VRFEALSDVAVMWCVIGWAVPDNSKDHCVLIFRVKQSKKNSLPFCLDSFTLKMTVPPSFKMSWMTYQSTWCNIPEDLNINTVSSTCLNKNEYYVTENDIVLQFSICLYYSWYDPTSPVVN